MKKNFVAGFTIWMILGGVVGMVHALPILSNGSLTGPISNGGVPTGWSITTPSPDTMDENNNVGGLNGNFQATPSSSPDGGTWVGFARDGSFIETFGQTVTGFSIGTSYDVSWYHANFGFSTYNGANAIEVLLDGASIGSGSLLGLSTTWVDEMLSFSATSLSHRIDFRLQSTAKSYHSIDGISLYETASGPDPVPEPATMLLFGTGLLGLAGVSMRRKKK